MDLRLVYLWRRDQNLNQREVLVMQIAEKLVKSSVKFPTIIMLGGAKIDQAISKISLWKETEGYLMSVAQHGQACGVADIYFTF